MNELISMDIQGFVFCKKDEAFTSSFTIAAGGKVEHRAVIQLINTHIEDFKDFGRVTFEMRPLQTNGGVQKVKMCALNKEQSTFLISLMKNTKPVVAFKKELVRQFYEMEKYIAAMVSARVQFPRLTETIKLIHENPKPYHFSNECDLLNRLVLGMTAKQFKAFHGLPADTKSIRPYLTSEQIELLDMLQAIDIGLLIAMPDYEQRKRHLEWYLAKRLTA